MSHENNLSRRAILAGAASVPALALPAAATAILAVDDTLARIELHRTCCAEFEDICGRESELEDVIPEERRKQRLYGDRYSNVGENDDPRWKAFMIEYLAKSDETYAIAWSFVERPPVSVAGAAALLACATTNLRSRAINGPIFSTTFRKLENISATKT